MMFSFFLLAQYSCIFLPALPSRCIGPKYPHYLSFSLCHSTFTDLPRAFPTGDEQMQSLLTIPVTTIQACTWADSDRGIPVSGPYTGVLQGCRHYYKEVARFYNNAAIEARAIFSTTDDVIPGIMRALLLMVEGRPGALWVALKG